MKKYWHEKTIDIDVYPGNFKIILTNHKEALDRMMDHDWKEYATTFHRSLEGRNTVAIVINPWNIPAVTHGVIAHECSHAADYIFEYIDAKHDFDNPEPYAYLVGWICEKVYEFIYEHKLQSKIKIKKDKWTKNPKSNPSTDS